MLWLLPQEALTSVLGGRLRKAVPWLRRLVSGFSPRRAGLVTESVHVRFVVGEVALGQLNLRGTVFDFRCQYHSTLDLHTHISHKG
jgi:hypothetical protein